MAEWRTTVIGGWPARVWRRHDIVSSAGWKWTCTECGRNTVTRDQAELDRFTEEHRHG